MNRPWRAIIAMCLGSVTLAACVTPRFNLPPYTDEAYAARWLPPLADGVTTRDDIIAAWGLPAAEFQDGRIAAYRLMLLESSRELSRFEYYWRLEELNADYRTGTFLGLLMPADVSRLAENHVFVPVRADNVDLYPYRLVTRPGEYGLILVYGADGRLARHALVRVYP